MMYDLELNPTLYRRDWWYHCRKCGCIAGGYKTAEIATQMAEAHVKAPHTP